MHNRTRRLAPRQRSRLLMRAMGRWWNDLLGPEELSSQPFEPRLGTLEPRIVLNATAELAALTGLSILGDGDNDHVEIQIVDNGNALQLLDSVGNPIPIAGHTTGMTGANTDPLPLGDIDGGSIRVDLGAGNDFLLAELPRPLNLNVVDGAGTDRVELNATGGSGAGISALDVSAETIDLRPSGLVVDWTNRDIQLSGDVIVGDAALTTQIDLGGSSFGIDGSVSLEGSLQVVGTTATIDWNAANVGAVAGGHDLEITLGSGSSVTLGSVDTFVDELSVSAGDIAIGEDLRVGIASFNADANVSVDALEIDAMRIEFLSSVEFSGAVVLDSGDVRFEDSITVADSATALVDATVLDSVSQATIQKLGAGELVLAGDSDITTNLEVLDGVLRVDGTLGSGVDVEVQGATLSGSGAIDGRASLIGGTLAPSAAFPLDREGALQIATLEVDSDSTLEFDVAGSVEGVTVDTAIVLNAPVNLSGAQVEFDQLAVLPNGAEFVLLQNQSSQSINGRLSAAFDVDGNALATPRVLEEGDLVLTDFGLGTQTPAYITYFGGDGNDVAVVTGGNHVQNGAAATALITRVDSNLHIRLGNDLADAQQATPTIRPIAALNGNFVTVRGGTPDAELFVDVDGFVDPLLPYEVNLSFQVDSVGNEGSVTFFDSNLATLDAPETVRAEFVRADFLRMDAVPDTEPQYAINLSGVNEVQWELPNNDITFFGTNQDDDITVTAGTTSGTTDLRLESQGLTHQFQFESPANTFSILARNGDDTLTVASLEDSFRAVPTLQGDVGDDTLRWQDDSILGVAGTSRDMSLEMERVFIEGDLELLGGGTLTVVATTELTMTGVVQVHDGRIAIDSGAAATDLSAAQLLSSNVADAVTIEGGDFILGQIEASLGRVVLGPSLSRSVGEITQFASTSIVAGELVGHSDGSIVLDSASNQFRRLDIGEAQDVFVLDSADDLVASVIADGNIELLSAGTVGLELISTTGNVQVTAPDGIASVSGFSVNVEANEIDLVSGIDLSGNPTVAAPALIGAAAMPLLVAPTTRVSATTSGTNGSVFLESRNNSVVGRLPVGLIDAGQGNIGLAARTIDDVASDAVIDLIGEEIQLSADAGIGETAALTLSQVSNVVADSTAGSIRLDLQADREITLHADTGGRNQSEVLLRHFGTDDLLLDRLANANGDVTVTSDNARLVVLEGSEAIEVGEAGRLQLSGGASSDDVLIRGQILSNAGDVVIDSASDLILESTASIDSTNGAIELEAGLRLPAEQGDVLLRDSSRVNAGSGTVSIASSGDITVSSIESNNALTAITLFSHDGEILDGGDQGLDLVADRGLVQLTSDVGIGNANALDTDVDRLQALVQGTGAVRIAETSAIELFDVLTRDGMIEVIANGDLTATSVRSDNVSGLDGTSHRDILLTAVGAASDILIDALVAADGADVMLSSGDDVLPVVPTTTFLMADDLAIVAANQTADQNRSVQLRTDVEQLELTVQGDFAGDVRIDEADSIELAASDRADDSEVISLGNGQLIVVAGEAMVIRDEALIADGESRRDDVEISARGSRGEIQLTAGTSIEMGDSVQLFAEQTAAASVRIEASAVTLGEDFQIETGNAVGVARVFAPRPDAGVTDSAFYDFDTVSTNRLEQAQINDALGVLTVDIGNEGERGLTINIDWGADSGRFQQIDGLSGEAPPLAVSHLYLENEILESRLNGRTSETAPLEVRFSVRHHESILVIGQSIEQGDSGVQAVEGELISSTDNPLTSEPGVGLILENGVASFIIPNLSIPVAFFPVRDVIPTIEIESVILPTETTFTVLGGSVETIASVASGSASRDEYFQIRVRSPDPLGDDLVEPTRLPDDIVSGNKLQRLFESLPDGRYEIEYVLGDGNVRSILSVELRDGKPIVPVENREGGTLRLRPMEDEAERSDELELPPPAIDDQSSSPSTPAHSDTSALAVTRTFSTAERLRSRLMDRIQSSNTSSPHTVLSTNGANIDD